MSVQGTKDPRNALASWNGYEFQGQIALIVVLEILIEKKFLIEKCELMLEDIEDFSIYYEGERISTHQVKATAGKNINNYKEALYNMSKGLQENNVSKKTKAYLHTSQKLDTTKWFSDVKKAIIEFVPEKEKELKASLSDSAQINMRVEKLKERHRKNGSIKTKKKGVWEEVYRLMKEVNEESEIQDVSLENAIKEYLVGLVTIDLSKDNLLDRILYYDYSNHINIDRKSTRGRIEELIREYWGAELAEKRDGSVDKYRYELQEIIHCYVVKHHDGNASEERIKFNDIKSVLEMTSLGTREYKILRNKDIFFEKLDEYCEDVCEELLENQEKCVECDLYGKKLWFEKMNIGEIERMFYLMSPHVNKSVEKDSNIVSENGLMDSYFHTLANLGHGKILHNSKVVYQDGKDNCMLTDIDIPLNGRERTIGKGLIENENIDNICNDIIENREFAKERMEIDILIVDNKTEEKIRLDEMCKKLTESTRKEDDWSYLKITEKKDLWLINASKFIDEYK